MTYSDNSPVLCMLRPDSEGKVKVRAACKLMWWSGGGAGWGLLQTKLWLSEPSDFGAVVAALHFQGRESVMFTAYFAHMSTSMKWMLSGLVLKWLLTTSLLCPWIPYIPTSLSVLTSCSNSKYPQGLTRILAFGNSHFSSTLTHCVYLPCVEVCWVASVWMATCMSVILCH